MSPILSDTAVLRRHGNFGSPMVVTVNLLPQFLEISDSTGKVLYHIPIETIKKVKSKLGGIITIKFENNKIGLGFNSIKSQMVNPFSLAKNNDKSRIWAATIQQMISTLKQS